MIGRASRCDLVSRLQLRSACFMLLRRHAEGTVVMWTGWLSAQQSNNNQLSVYYGRLLFVCTLG